MKELLIKSIKNTSIIILIRIFFTNFLDQDSILFFWVKQFGRNKFFLCYLWWIGNLNNSTFLFSFPGHRYQRQSALVLRAGLLIRHSGECAARLPGRLDIRHRPRSRRQLDADVHGDIRLGERRVLAEPANRRLHIDGTIGLRGGELSPQKEKFSESRQIIFGIDWKEG